MWVFDPESGELKEQKENPENQGMDLSGASGVATAGGGIASPTTPAPTSSGNFTDMSKYLELNAPQAQNLGEKVAGGIAEKTGAAENALQQGEQQFNQTVASSDPWGGLFPEKKPVRAMGSLTLPTNSGPQKPGALTIGSQNILTPTGSQAPMPSMMVRGQGPQNQSGGGGPKGPQTSGPSTPAGPQSGPTPVPGGGGGGAPKPPQAGGGGQNKPTKPTTVKPGATATAPWEPGFNYVDFAKNPENVANFQAALQGDYTGPQDFSGYTGYADLIKQLGTASQASEQAKTTGGREELIRNIYEHPERATEGMLALDEALVKQTPTAIQAIQDKAAEAKTLQDKLTDVETRAQAAVGQKKDELTKEAQEIRDKFLGSGGIYEQLKAAIDARVAKYSSESTAAEQEARNYLDRNWLMNQGILGYRTPPTPAGFSPGYVMPQELYVNWAKMPSAGISPEALSQLGITQQQYNDLLVKLTNPGTQLTAIDPNWQGVNFADYATFGGTGDINRGSVATNQERQNLAALSTLFGSEVDPNFIPASSSHVSGAQDLTNFNYQALLDYLSNPQYLQAAVH